MLRSLSSFLFLFALVGCSGGGAKTPAPSSDAGAPTDGGTFAQATPAPSNLPPMATMPPPGVAGSKKAKRRHDAALSACAIAAAPSKDPADTVKRLGEGCAAPSKMKPVGTMLRGQQSEREGHQENRFRAEANHCYRVYVAGEEGVRDLVVVLRDSAGDIVAEAPAPAVPDDGPVCFTAGDEVSVLVGVGAGKGAWAAQVWGD